MMTTDGSERRDECPRGREVGARRRGVDRDGRARGPDDDGTARRERWRRGIVESIHRRRTRWAMRRGLSFDSSDDGSVEDDDGTQRRSTSFTDGTGPGSTLRRLLSRRKSNPGDVEAALRDVEARESSERRREPETSARGRTLRARVNLKGGDVYRGPWIDGAPVGFGRYSWANGSEYAGEFVSGEPSGSGTYDWASGGVYKGEFERGKMNGTGTYTSPSGTEYRGSWKDGKKHGWGMQNFANDDRYEGMWKDGLAHGPGTYRWSSRDGEEGQDEFDGEWLDGMMHGWGTLRWASGDRYDGNWCKGEISGHGSLTWRDGSSFSGQWKRGKRDGSGAFMMPPMQEKDTGGFLRSISNMGGLKRLQPKTSFEEVEQADESTEIDDAYVLLCKCSEDKVVDQEVVESERVGHKHSTWLSSPMTSRSQKVRQVLHGETIYKGHGSYELMIQLRMGIRWSVGKTKGVASMKLAPADFERTVRQIFPRSGSSATPPHFARTFKWKEYRPEVFRKLRARWNVDPADFVLSLCGDQALSELASPGKSGSVFYVSHDDKFIIKTMRKSEMLNLKSWLHLYYKHVHEYPESLLPKFFGIYSIKALGSATKVRVVVMANLFPSKYPIHRTFDLKGSRHGRFTKPTSVGNENPTVFKDLDISSKFRVEEGKRDKLLHQLRTDCALLQRLRVMDYSLLVGVHILPPSPSQGDVSSPVGGHDRGDSYDSAPTWGGVEWREQAIQAVRQNFKALDLYESRKKFGFAHGIDTTAASTGESLRPPPGTDELLARSAGAETRLGVAMSAVAVHGRVIKKQHQLPKGKSALEEHSDPHDVILHMGIIDILQEYTTSKSLETKMMGAMGKKSFSSIEPTAYSKRFLKFITRLFE